MKTIKSFIFVAIMSLFSVGLTGCFTPYATTTVVQDQNEYPGWAPAYESGMRYYYFPDIEVYYDIVDRDFVYLYEGRWHFSRTLPSIYAGFDLYNGFVISLNFNVYQPWRHHHYYISHYPRYYYRSYYRNYDPQRMRGYNENRKTPHYRGNYKPDKYDQEQYRGGRRSDGYQRDSRSTTPRQQGTDRNTQEQNNRGRQDQYQRNEKEQTPRSSGAGGRGTDQNTRGRSEQQQQQQQNVKPTDNQGSDRKVESTREPQNPNYYGRQIGRPVKVERQMREQKPRETKQETKSESKSENNQQQRGRR